MATPFVRVSAEFTRLIKFKIETTNVELGKKLIASAGKAALGFAFGAGFGLSDLYKTDESFRQKIVNVVKSSFGGQREDQEFSSIQPNCLLVELRCLTDERFRDVLDDYASERIKERLEKEFCEVGITVRGLKIDIINMEEVNQAKKAIEQSYIKLSPMATSKGDSITQVVPIVEAEDIMTMVDPAFSCENALSHAPYVISSLVHLLLISAETDFSLIGHPPENTKFKFLKYVYSFRACLVQVSNVVGRAFQKAHNGMVQIRLKSASIDENVKKAVKFIKQGKENELAIVHSCLQNIDKQCDECVNAAASITDEFQVALDTMNELMEACVGTMGRYNKQQEESIILKETAAEKKKHIKKSLDDIQRRYDEEKDDIEKAKKDYEIAVSSSPSTWEIILFGSINQIVYFARDITASLIPALMQPAGLPLPSTSHTIPDKEGPASLSKPTISDDEAKAYLVASDILIHAELLLSFANSDQDCIEAVKKWFQESVNELKEIPSDAISVKIALKLSEDGVKRCQDILNCLKKSVNGNGNAAAGNPTKTSDDKETKNRCKKLYDDAMSFNIDAKKALSNLDSNVNDGSTLTTILLQNAERKKQEALKILLTCYERYERCQEKIREERKEMEKVLNDLAKFDHQNLDLNKIRDALYDGMKVLCDVIKHWKRFQEMFQWLRNLISDRFRPSLKDFHTTADVGIKHFAKNEGSLTSEVIIEEAEKASRIAFMINSVSDLYVNVSQKYLRNALEDLLAMVSLDAKRDREKMGDMRNKIQVNCQRAQDGIQTLVEKRRRNIRQKVMKQQENIDKPSGEIPALTRRQDDARYVGYVHRFQP